MTRAALDAPATGQGPTLVEAYTYRMGAHTTSDDPTRYRLAERASRHWKLKDPIERLQGLPGRATASPTTAFFDAVDGRGRRARPRSCASGCWRMPDPEPLTMFDHVYAEQTPRAGRSSASEFAAYLASFEGSAH